MKIYIFKNTILFLFLTGFLINLTPIGAQTYVNREWVQILGTPDTIQWSASVINNNNQLITTGNTFTPGQQANILTTAYDEDGNIVWQRQWNGVQNGSDYGSAITTDINGNIYVTGASHYTTDSTFDIVLIVYSQYGNELFTTNFSGENLNNIPFAIATDNYDNIYIAGTSEDPNNGFDYILLKISSNGDHEWSVRYDYNGGIDIATTLVITDNGEEIAITGGSETTNGNWDYTTVLYDNSGDLRSIDRQPSDETEIEKPKDIAKDAQNNFYITGVESDGMVNQIKIIKLGHDLQPQWVHFSGSGNEEGSNTIAVDKYYNPYIGGWVEETPGIRNALLMKYDINGNLIWSRNFSPDPLKPYSEITKLTIRDNLINFIGFATDGFSSDIITGQFSPDGEINWIRSWTNMGNSVDYPTSIVSCNNNVYVTGRTYLNNTIQWVTVRYSFFELNSDIVNDTINQSIYLDRQVVTKINGEYLKHPFHHNRELQFYSLNDLMHDTLITQMENKTGIDFSGADLKVIKLHWDLTPADTLSVSRLGDTVRIPDFWNTLILEIPEGENLPAIRDSLRSLHYIVFDADLTYISESLSVPNDDYFYMQHSLHASSPNPPYPDAHINILPAWDIETGKPNIRIAVIDDPVYWIHPDFLNPYFQPFGTVIADGWDYQTNSSIFTTFNPFISHGTRVAGIIGAIRNNHDGISGITGGNGVSDPGTRLYSLGIRKLTPLHNVPYICTHAASNAIAKSANQLLTSGGYGAHVINCSWGSDESSFYLSDAIISAYINNCIVVASRGNNKNDILTYPACYDDKLVVSVGASGTDGTYKRNAGFGHPSNPNNGLGNNGDYSSCYSHVDIIAPGVIELVRTTNWPDSPLPYYPFSGTSAAAPHVTGVAGLLLSRHHPSQGYPNGLAPEDVEYILKNTATDISGPPPNTIGINFPAGPDPYNGHGRLNAGEALKHINLPEYQILHPTAPVIKTQTLHTSNTLVMFSRNLSFGGQSIEKDVLYEADLYQVNYTTNPTIPVGYQVVDIWKRESSSYGVNNVNYINEPTAATNFADIHYIDLTNNPITVQANNFFWHIKNKLGTSQNINIYYPPWCDVLGKAAYSILLQNPTASIAKPKENNSKLNIYPNPASEQITINLPEIGTHAGRIYIYDMFGKIVYQQVMSATDSGHITIPVINLAKGVYLCVVVANNKRYTERFCRL